MIEHPPMQLPLSTMDLVNMDFPQESYSPSIKSTLQYDVKHDFDPARKRHEREENTGVYNHHKKDSSFWNELLSVDLSKFSNHPVSAREMDLIEAATNRDHYDKLILVMKHGEPLIPQESDEVLHNSSLSQQGVGQSLTLSRRISSFCNKETGLLPQLFVVAPLKHSIESAFLAFPHFSPHSIKAVPWYCLQTAATDSFSIDHMHSLKKDFNVLEYSACFSSGSDSIVPSEPPTAEGLVQKVDSVLEWIQGRNEKIVVGTYLAVD